MPSADIALYPNQLPRVVSRGPVLVREDFLYTNPNGEEKAGPRKRSEKALDNLQAIIGKLLEPQEAVFYIARVIAPLSTFEQLTLGWQGYHMYGAVLVFTNRRILRFGVRNKGWRSWTWRNTLHSVRWGDLADAQCKGLIAKTLRLKYRNGRKETYLGVSRADAKKIRTLLAALLPNAAGEASTTQEMISLCPECVATLTPRAYQCPQCRLDFKTERTLLWRTIFLPGGGYFYVGWKGWGVFFGFVELFFLFEFGFWLSVALGLVSPPSPGPNQPPYTVSVALATFVMMLFLYALETAIVYLHMRRFVREFVPAR